MKSRHNPVGMVHKHYYVSNQIKNLDWETKKNEWAVHQLTFFSEIGVNTVKNDQKNRYFQIKFQLFNNSMLNLQILLFV